MLINVNNNNIASDDDIIDLLKKAESGVRQYETIMLKFQNWEEYEKEYEKFYKLGRRSKEMRKDYFAFLNQKRKEKDIKAGEFNIRIEDPLDYLMKKHKKLEMSFSSKLIHTLDPNKPIWDSIVTLKHFGRKVPSCKTENRIAAAQKEYECYCRQFKVFLGSDEGKKIIELFDKMYPNNTFTAVKKVDFVLWRDK